MPRTSALAFSLLAEHVCGVMLRAGGVIASQFDDKGVLECDHAKFNLHTSQVPQAAERFSRNGRANHSAGSPPKAKGQLRAL